LKETDKNILMFVGSTYPPNMGGASKILYDLLSGLDPNKIDVLAGKLQNSKENDRKLLFKVKWIPVSWLLRKGFTAIWRFYLFEDTVRYIYHGLNITSSKKYDRIFLIFPSTSSFVGGYIVACLRNIPFQIYTIDLLANSRLHKLEYYLLKFFEKKILKKSHKVYVLNQSIVEFYNKLVEREYILLPHTADITKINDVSLSKRESKEKVIVFAGQIHSISLDALQNLIRAVRLITEYPVKIQIFTNQPDHVLKKMGLLNSFVETRFISDYDELLEMQRRADILFSPVAFDPRYPKQAETCFPTKTFDYIKAERPILVHAPDHYYYTRYMDEHNSALIVSSFAPEELKKGILRLLTDKKLQHELIKNANIMVKKNHNRTELQSRLFNNLFS